jgi:hypothetical protein
MAGRRVMAGIRILPLLFLSLATLAQEAKLDRVIPLSHVESPAPLVTALRSVTQTPEINYDAVRRAIVMRGPASAVTIVEWYVKHLDRPTWTQAAETLTLGGGDDQVLLVTGIEGNLNELATVIRSVLEIRQLWAYSPAKALILRAKAAEIERVRTARIRTCCACSRSGARTCMRWQH